MLLALGCRRPAPPTASFEPGEVVALDGQLFDAAGTAPVGPGPWSAHGLTLDVPAGWSGSAGPPPRLLTLQAARARSTFTVEARAAPSELDADCYFDGVGDFRTVPALGVARTRSCVTATEVRQTWWADGLVVEVSWPLGAAVLGRQEVAPLLEGLTRE